MIVTRNMYAHNYVCVCISFLKWGHTGSFTRKSSLGAANLTSYFRVLLLNSHRRGNTVQCNAIHKLQIANKMPHKLREIVKSHRINAAQMSCTFAC